MTNKKYYKAKHKISDAFLECDNDIDILVKFEQLFRVLNHSRNEINGKIDSLNKIYDESDTISLRSRLKKISDEINDVCHYLDRKHCQYLKFDNETRRFKPGEINIIDLG